MKKDLGLELLKILKIQRQSYIRTADGCKLITNHVLYNQMENESERLQRLISDENKKKYPFLKLKRNSPEFNKFIIN
jgi:hypothetical protein